MRLIARLWLPGAALALITLFAAACTVVADDGPAYRPRPERPRICTAEYVPVCARRGHERQSFSNGCMAERAGYRVVRRGLCQGDGGDGGRAFCTREYAPVCARRGREVRTFPNACEARAARWRVIGNGRC